MVNVSSESFQLGFLQLYLSLNSWGHPFLSSCYTVHSPPWTCFLPMWPFSCWPSCLTLLRYCFLQSLEVALLHSGSRKSAVVPHFRTKMSYVILHSSKSTPPHWLWKPRSVVQPAQGPSRTTTISFVTWEKWLAWLAFPTNNTKLMMQKINSWAPRQCLWTMGLDSSLMDTYNKTQTKKVYTGVVLAKIPPMIKLEKSSPENVLLENST